MPNVLIQYMLTFSEFHLDTYLNLDWSLYFNKGSKFFEHPEKKKKKVKRAFLCDFRPAAASGAQGRVSSPTVE